MVLSPSSPLLIPGGHTPEVKMRGRMSGGKAVLACLLAFFVSLVTAIGTAAYDTLSVPFEDIHKAVLKDAIGILTVWCTDEGMEIYGGSEKERMQLAEAQRRQLFLDTYVQCPGAFRKVAPLAVHDTVPLSKLEHEGVIRRFPATRKAGQFVEMIYDVRRNLRAWVQLTPSWPPGCEVSYDSLSDDGPISPMPVDLYCLATEHPVGLSVRLYRSPDKNAKWSRLQYGSDYTDVLVEIRNGFGLLVWEDCEGKRIKTLGWVPLRDKRGRLIVWICDICGCC
jgi:hypothetical protein